MKIGLLGYGKMGKAIEKLAQAAGDEIVWKIGSHNRLELDATLLRRADVVIEFTRPDSAFENVQMCLAAGVPVVCGTTGWLERLPDAQKFCHEKRGTLLWASNFSVGVNLFFAVNKYLAKLMASQTVYQPAMTEIHHIYKLDAPSGTAVSLAQQILDESNLLKNWSLGKSDDPQVLGIEALREGEVPGTHEIRWTSPIDEITIRHEAKNREGFASGALLAARWLVGKTGFFMMEDVLFPKN